MKNARMSEVSRTVEHTAQCRTRDPAALSAHLRKFIDQRTGYFDVTASARDPLCNCDFVERMRAVIS